MAEKVKGFTGFSRETGVEVTEAAKKNGNKNEGIVVLRFFTFNPEDRHLKFIMSPAEAYGISRLMTKVTQNGGRQSVMHKFESNGTTITTNLIIEKWSRNGREGYALAIKRDSRTINVPLTEDMFCYIGELLRDLSVSQAYVETVEEAEV